jgi:serine O-acetyltransferase
MSFWGTVKRDARHFLDGPFYTVPVSTTPVRVLILLLSPEFRLVLRYRIYNRLYYKGMKKLAFLLYLRAKRIHGCDIAADARIGPGLRLGHCQDIVIGSAARLGNDVVVFNGVTMGNRSVFDKEFRMPTVGNRVLVGTGAKLVGDVVIGDDARIGANAVVLQSVPAGATAVGNPARIIPPKTAVNKDQ